MNFNYKYKVKTSDLWQASMYYTYSSFLAVINVICIVSSVVLIFAMWNKTGDFGKFIMILYFSAFTIIQPLAVYLNAKSQLNGKYPEIELSITNAGIKIVSDGAHQNMGWKDVFRVVSKPTIVIIYMRDGAGYILTNKVTGNTKKALVQFIRNNIKA